MPAGPPNISAGLSRYDFDVMKGGLKKSPIAQFHAGYKSGAAGPLEILRLA
jgi:hypothetical protein